MSLLKYVGQLLNDSIEQYGRIEAADTAAIN
jgi:hypothetical protein